MGWSYTRKPYLDAVLPPGIFLLWINGDNPVVAGKLQLNGHDRFSEREGRYFNLVQPYQHHENVPATGINVYSFGLKPEEHQPYDDQNAICPESTMLLFTSLLPETLYTKTEFESPCLRYQLQCTQNHVGYGWTCLFQLN